jgi:hypothetical protein
MTKNMDKTRRIALYEKIENKKFNQKEFNKLYPNMFSRSLYWWKLIHGNNLDFSKVTLWKSKDSYKKCVKVICPKHGLFLAAPWSLMDACGCPKCKNSKLEEIVDEYFKENGIRVIRQKKFHDCRDKNPLPFDFEIPGCNTVIECQGKQHYEPVEYWGGQEKFELGQKHDKIKRDYCRVKGIRLIEIKYDCKNISAYLDTFKFKHDNSVPVKCIETNEIFQSYTEAAKYIINTNMSKSKNEHTVSSVIWTAVFGRNGRIPTGNAYKKHWIAI